MKVDVIFNSEFGGELRSDIAQLRRRANGVRRGDGTIAGGKGGGPGRGCVAIGIGFIKHASRFTGNGFAIGERRFDRNISDRRGRHIDCGGPSVVGLTNAKPRSPTRELNGSSRIGTTAGHVNLKAHLFTVSSGRRDGHLQIGGNFDDDLGTGGLRK
ncbi:MAG: hypothetical protein AB7J46_07740 [Candidatus Altimarinota bacterium]